MRTVRAAGGREEVAVPEPLVHGDQAGQCTEGVARPEPVVVHPVQPDRLRDGGHAAGEARREAKPAKVRTSRKRLVEDCVRIFLPDVVRAGSTRIASRGVLLQFDFSPTSGALVVSVPGSPLARAVQLTPVYWHRDGTDFGKRPEWMWRNADGTHSRILYLDPATMVLNTRQGLRLEYLSRTLCPRKRIAAQAFKTRCQLERCRRRRRNGRMGRLEARLKDLERAHCALRLRRPPTGQLRPDQRRSR